MEDNKMDKTTFEIEPCRLTSREVTAPAAPYTPKYPFKGLEPGQCFFVPAGDAAMHRRCKAAMWAYNNKRKGKLQWMLAEDGRLCVFYPLDAIKEKLEPEADLHPTQLEFVSWMSSLPQDADFTLTKDCERFTEFGAWIEEYNLKSGAKITWEIAGKEMKLKVITK